MLNPERDHDIYFCDVITKNRGGVPVGAAEASGDRNQHAVRKAAQQGQVLGQGRYVDSKTGLIAETGLNAKAGQVYTVVNTYSYADPKRRSGGAGAEFGEAAMEADDLGVPREGGNDVGGGAFNSMFRELACL